MRWACSRLLRGRLKQNVGLNRGRTLANHIWGIQLSYSRTTALCRCAALRGPHGIQGHATCSSTEYPLMQNGEAAASPTPLSPPPQALGVSHAHVLLCLPLPPSQPPSRSTSPTDTPGPSLSRTFPCTHHHVRTPEGQPAPLTPSPGSGSLGTPQFATGQHLCSHLPCCPLTHQSKPNLPRGFGEKVRLPVYLAKSLPPGSPPCSFLFCLGSHLSHPGVLLWPTKPSREHGSPSTVLWGPFILFIFLRARTGHYHPRSPSQKKDSWGTFTVSTCHWGDAGQGPDTRGQASSARPPSLLRHPLCTSSPQPEGCLAGLPIHPGSVLHPNTPIGP